MSHTTCHIGKPACAEHALQREVFNHGALRRMRCLRSKFTTTSPKNTHFHARCRARTWTTSRNSAALTACPGTEFGSFKSVRVQVRNSAASMACLYLEFGSVDGVFRSGTWQRRWRVHIWNLAALTACSDPELGSVDGMSMSRIWQR